MEGSCRSYDTETRSASIIKMNLVTRVASRRSMFNKTRGDSRIDPLYWQTLRNTHAGTWTPACTDTEIKNKFYLTYSQTIVIQFYLFVLKYLLRVRESNNLID